MVPLENPSFTNCGGEVNIMYEVRTPLTKVSGVLLCRKCITIAVVGSVGDDAPYAEDDFGVAIC